MRRVSHGVTVILAGAAVLLGVSSCGNPMPAVDAGNGVVTAPVFGLLQGGGRMLHYIIDTKEKNGNTLKAEVSLYQTGRLTITGDMSNAGSNPTALIKVRLTNREQESLWQTEISTLFCEAETCSAGTRQQIWNYELGPSRAARVANVWLTLDVLE